MVEELDNGYQLPRRWQMKKIMVFIGLMVILLVACTGEVVDDQTPLMDDQADLITSLEGQVDALNQEINALSSQIKALEDQETTSQPPEPLESASMSLLMSAQTVIEMLQVNDMAGVATFVDPSLGLRFSPYSVIDLVNDLVFTPSQVSGLWTDPTLYTWGTHAASGDPITMVYSSYHNAYVYDQNYASPHMIGNHVTIGTGNMINTVTTAYPTASFVEYHFTGFNPTYAGMDWVSLRLIFENISGVWKLIGIEHDAWTS